MVENDSGKISSFGEKSMINITDQKRGKLYIKDDCFLYYDTYPYLALLQRLKRENGDSDEGKDINQIEIVLNNLGMIYFFYE